MITRRFCPQCGYDLLGLERLCPECGASKLVGTEAHLGAVLSPRDLRSLHRFVLLVRIERSVDFTVLLLLYTWGMISELGPGVVIAALSLKAPVVVVSAGGSLRRPVRNLFPLLAAFRVVLHGATFACLSLSMLWIVRERPDASALLAATGPLTACLAIVEASGFVRLARGMENPDLYDRMRDARALAAFVIPASVVMACFPPLSWALSSFVAWALLVVMGRKLMREIDSWHREESINPTEGERNQPG